MSRVHEPLAFKALFPFERSPNSPKAVVLSSGAGLPGRLDLFGYDSCVQHKTPDCRTAVGISEM